MITLKLQRATANITAETINQRSMLATTARSAHPRNYTDLPTIIIAICVTRRTTWTEAVGATKLFELNTNKPSVILRNTYGAYYISV